MGGDALAASRRRQIGLSPNPECPSPNGYGFHFAVLARRYMARQQHRQASIIGFRKPYVPESLQPWLWHCHTPLRIQSYCQSPNRASPPWSITASGLHGPKLKTGLGIHSIKGRSASSSASSSAPSIRRSKQHGRLHEPMG